jgi:hypothetical protein
MSMTAEQIEKMDGLYSQVGCNSDWSVSAWCLCQNGESHNTYGLLAMDYNESDDTTISIVYAGGIGSVSDAVYDVLGSEAGYVEIMTVQSVDELHSLASSFAPIASSGKALLQTRNAVAMGFQIGGAV